MKTTYTAEQISQRIDYRGWERDEVNGVIKQLNILGGASPYFEVLDPKLKIDIEVDPGIPVVPEPHMIITEDNPERALDSFLYSLYLKAEWTIEKDNKYRAEIDKFVDGICEVIEKAVTHLDQPPAPDSCYCPTREMIVSDILGVVKNRFTRPLGIF